MEEQKNLRIKYLQKRQLQRVNIKSEKKNHAVTGCQKGGIQE